MIDPKDVASIAGGAALLGLTVLPLVCGARLVSVSTPYVAAGTALALSPFALAAPNPLGDETARFLIEHLR